MKIFIKLATVALLLQSCSLPQAISYNLTHSLGASAPQSAPSITNEKRKIGNPYQIFGRWYYPQSQSEGYREYGVASWYGKDFHAKKTANGEDYNMYSYTAAHKTLPLPTYVRVTNTQNGKSIVARVNDRGPFVKDRLIDMSYSGAKALGFDEQGTAPVLVEAISIYGGDVKKGNYKKPTTVKYASKPNNANTNRQSYTNSRYKAQTKPQAKPVVNKPTQGYSFTNRVSNKQNINNKKETASKFNENTVKDNSYTNNTVSANTIVNTGSYFIQLGSFTDIMNARRLYYQATPKLSGVKIKQLQLNDKVYYRVVVENVNPDQAESKLEQVKQAGFYNAIVGKK